MATPRSKARRVSARPLDGPLGHYAFRFTGFTRVANDSRDRNGVPYHIVGVGYVVFLAHGEVIGRQSSTVIAISGPGPTLQRTVFELTGSYLTRADKTGALTVFFHRVSNPNTAREKIADVPEMSDVFEFVTLDRGARLHLVSTAPTMLPEKVLVDELVSVEAFRQ